MNEEEFLYQTHPIVYLLQSAKMLAAEAVSTEEAAQFKQIEKALEFANEICLLREDFDKHPHSLFHSLIS